MQPGEISTVDAAVGNFQTFVSSTDMAVSVSFCAPYRDCPRVRAVAEASKIDEKRWYVNRVLVQPATARKGGLGSYVVGLLVATLRLRADFESIVVEPGGYSDDLKGQRKFYRKQGFKRIDANLYELKR